MIKEILFDGLNGYELSTKNWKMVLITECGPRIAYLGKQDDKNILYWDKDGVARQDWKLHGGHRVWITRPYADESEDTYMADNDPCVVELSDNSVIAMSPPHEFTKLSRGIKVEIIDDSSFRVTNLIKNDGQLIYSGGVWSPTCINPEGKEIVVDLGQDDVTWDIVKIVIPRIFAGNEVKINDEQISFTEDQMILKPNGVLTKRCVQAPKGIVYMNWDAERIRFTKQVKYNKNGRYPLDGCNIAVFLGQDNWMAEMETFGEEHAIKPGETVFNEEIWNLESY